MSKLSKKLKNPSSLLTAAFPVVGANKYLIDKLKPKKPGQVNAENGVPGLIDSLNEGAITDQQTLMAEAEEQKKLGTQYAGSYDTRRKENLSRLAGILAEQQNRQLQQNIPGLASQANLQGVYRSTGLGNSIAREAGQLAANTTSDLAQQGVADSYAGIADTQGVDNQYLQGRYGSLQRRMSIEDLARNAAIGSVVGKSLQPEPVKQNAKGGTLNGALGGASAGAAFGPWGAGIGAVAGGVLGNQAMK